MVAPDRDPAKIEIVVGSRRESHALYTAMGAALVGTLLGGLAVYLGLQGRSGSMSSSAVSATADSPRDASSETASNVPPPPARSQAPVRAPSQDTPVVGGLAAVVGTTLPSVVCLSFDPKGGEPSFAGAGVIYEGSGFVLTNHHVIEPMLRARPSGLAQLGTRGRLSARFFDGRVRDATVLLASPEEDLAILKLDDVGAESEALATATFGRSRELSVGETVFAVGCPVGLEHTVSAGIVSALHRTGVMPNPHLPTIQLDAAINLGNSGGPLFNAIGELVGITSARSSRGEGIGFAIPIDRVRVYLTALYEGEAGRSGVIGAVVSAAQTPPDSLRAMGYAAGLTIEKVDQGGPADAAGIVPGDVIVEIRGRRHPGTAEGQAARLEFLRDFMDVARNLLPGEELELTVVRGDERVPVRIEVQAASEAEQARIDIEAVLGLRVYDKADPVVLAFVPGSRLEGNRQAQKMLLDARITVVGTREIRTVDDLGRVAATLKPLVAEGRGRQVRMRLENAKGETYDVTYPLDWRR